MLDSLVPALHAVSTWFMLGVIWFVQGVHYPLMAASAGSRTSAYAREHQRRTAYVVLVPMLTELSTCVWLTLGPWRQSATAWAGLTLLGIAWASTFFLQLPAHRQLAHEFNPRVHRKLVRSNWLRTIAWTVRGILLL